MKLLSTISVGVMLLLLLSPSGAPAQQGREVSNGFYEEYEVRPGLSRQALVPRSEQRGILAYGPTTSQVLNRSRLEDSHVNLPFYEGRSCVDCHKEEGRDNIHVVRNGVKCRQCHGPDPISGNEYYYSRMNLIRRHAYVCAQCHQGASISFATYVVHEPPPGDMATARTFPALYWGFWIMAGIAVVTFALFVPHALLWFLRDLTAGKGKHKGGSP